MNRRTTKKLVDAASKFFETVWINEDNYYCFISIDAGKATLVKITLDKKNRSSVFAILEDGFCKAIGGYGLKLEWKKVIRQFIEEHYFPFTEENRITEKIIHEGRICVF
jgi:hypothetical protein